MKHDLIYLRHSLNQPLQLMLRFQFLKNLRSLISVSFFIPLSMQSIIFGQINISIQLKIHLSQTRNNTALTG